MMSWKHTTFNSNITRQWDWGSRWRKKQATLTLNTSCCLIYVYFATSLYYFSIEMLATHVCKGPSVCQSLSRVWLFATPWTVAHQAPLSMGFSRQEYWSGLPFSPPGDLPDPVIKPTSPPPGDLPDSGIKASSVCFPALSGGFFTPTAPGEPR